jgi:hypothetical protein
MPQLIVKDNKGNDYIVKEPNHFRQHIFDFHTLNGKADFSLHEENGHYFTVTTELLDEVNEFIKMNKK